MTACRDPSSNASRVLTPLPWCGGRSEGDFPRPPCRSSGRGDLVTILWNAGDQSGLRTRGGFAGTPSRPGEAEMPEWSLSSSPCRSGGAGRCAPTAPAQERLADAAVQDPIPGPKIAPAVALPVGVRRRPGTSRIRPLCLATRGQDSDVHSERMTDTSSNVACPGRRSDVAAGLDSRPFRRCSRG